MSTNQKITLFIMSEKGYQSLKGILDCFGPDVIDAVVLGRDKNVQNDYAADIEKLATENGLQIHERQDDFIIRTKYVFAISWRWLIDISDANVLVTLHDSILPKYRGFAPLVNMLLNREPYIGVTAIVSNTEYDKGDIIAQEKCSVQYPIKIKDAIAQIAQLYSALLEKIIALINQGIELPTTPQNNDEATYSLWRNEDDYAINWQNSAESILNLIYAVGPPYLGASAHLLGKKIRITDAKLVPDVTIENRDAGKVIFMNDKKPVIVCGNGLLQITEAVYDVSQESIFPLKRFRIKLS